MNRWRLVRDYRYELLSAALLCLPPILLVVLGGVWLWQEGRILAFLALCVFRFVTSRLDHAQAEAGASYSLS